jgi:DNA gyrase subunit A
MYNIDLKNMVEDNFEVYAGMVIQKRALVDVRDCLKPSARQLMYAQYIDKIDWKHKYQKSLKSVGSGTSHFYVHGDGSAYGVLIRMGKPFAMRYMLEDVSGNAGTMTKNGNEASSRYTEMRLAPICANLFENIDKNTVTWADNYDNTEQYPTVFPSMGYYNIVNGTLGIGVALASSIPQFNLCEVNTALIKLLNNPSIDFDEIYCRPDFATGGTLINADEVKESLRVGRGSACKLRAKMEYNEKEHCLVVTEIPYGTYTDNICAQMAKLLDEEPNCGIEKFVDRTKTSPNIKIFLTKRANINQVVKLLYSKTDLQSYYSVNMTMLDNGTTPRVFGWKEALEAHLHHEADVLRSSLQFDKQKKLERLNIVNGLLIAIANIEEVISIIKNSSDGASAKRALEEKYSLNEAQSKAILDIKLVRLANLEAVKVENEKKDLLAEIDEIDNLLSSTPAFNKVIEDKLTEVMKKYGDARRTEIQNISFNDEEVEPIEEKELIVHLSNLGNLYPEEKTTLLVQRRGGKGSKVKLAKNEYLIDTISDTNKAACLAFSNKGKVYSLNMALLTPSQKTNVREFFELGSDEEITKILPFNKLSQYKYIVFTTRNGLIKKTEMEEYRIRKSKGVLAIKLKDDDSIVGIDFVNNEKIKFLTKLGKSVIINSQEINATGRATAGVCGIKLNDGDEVVCAAALPENTTHIVLISKSALTKKIPMSEFSIANRATKGSSIQKLKEGDSMASFIAVTSEDKDITLVSNIGMIKIPLDSMEEHSKTTQGVHSKVLAEKEHIIKVVR